MVSELYTIENKFPTIYYWYFYRSCFKITYISHSNAVELWRKQNIKYVFCLLLLKCWHHTINSEIKLKNSRFWTLLYSFESQFSLTVNKLKQQKTLNTQQIIVVLLKLKGKSNLFWKSSETQVKEYEMIHSLSLRHYFLSSVGFPILCTHYWIKPNTWHHIREVEKCISKVVIALL